MPNKLIAILRKYDTAANAYAAQCHTDPSRWHRPDVTEFTRLRALLIPYAEAGDPRAQYALATISSLGLCCETEEVQQQSRQISLEEATRWWTASAAQGHCPALDNLVTSGLGAEADRARQAWSQLEKDRPDLMARRYRGMPVYGPKFVQELSRRLYGKVDETIT